MYSNFLIYNPKNEFFEKLILIINIARMKLINITIMNINKKKIYQYNNNSIYFKLGDVLKFDFISYHYSINRILIVNCNKIYKCSNNSFTFDSLILPKRILKNIVGSKRKKGIKLTMIVKNYNRNIKIFTIPCIVKV
jgi:hypothetical protein